MPRLFFALSLPDALADELEGLCDGIHDARWVDSFHLTLSFLGDVHQHQIPDIVDAAASISFQPFQLTLNSVGVFPLRGDPSVLWVGVEKSDRLAALHKTLKAEMRQVGLVLEKRKFHPHVTLARFKEPPDQTAFDWLATHMTYRSGPFWVREFHLISSILSPRGSQYRVERSFGALGRR